MATNPPHATKTAFVTGASSGIGKAAAVALTQAGYRVIGTSRRAAPGEVRGGIRMIACDVTDAASVAAAVARHEHDVEPVEDKKLLKEAINGMLTTENVASLLDGVDLVIDGTCSFTNIDLLKLSRFDRLEKDWREKRGWMPIA